MPEALGSIPAPKKKRQKEMVSEVFFSFDSLLKISDNDTHLRGFNSTMLFLW
jgi:hypothetical protein